MNALQRQAAAALKKVGLTMSDAFRLLLVRVAAEKVPAIRAFTQSQRRNRSSHESRSPWRD